MTRLVRQVATSLFATVLCVVAVALPAFAVPATDSPDEDQREELMDELMTWSGDAYIEAGFIDDYSFGPDVKLYSPSTDFKLRVVTENLSSEIVALDDVVMLPLLRDGAGVGIVVTAEEPDGSNWYTEDVLGSSCATQIAELQPNDRVMEDVSRPGNIWFAVRGEETLYLDGCSRAPDPLVTTLVEYQQYLWDAQMPYPGMHGGGSGTGTQGADAGELPDKGGNSAMSLNSLGIVAVLCAVGAFVILGARRLATQ